MKKFVSTFMLTAAILLAGCASAPVGMDVTKIQALRSGGLSVELASQSTAVSIKTKGQAIGGMVLGSVAGSVAGTPSGPSPQVLQQSQELAQETNNLVQTAAAGYSQHVAPPVSPASATRDGLDRWLVREGIKAGPQSYRAQIAQKTWLLAYDSLFGSDNYRLHYVLDIDVLDASGNRVAHSECAGDSPVKQALDAWKADDFAKVKAYAAQAGEACSARVLSDLGLAG